VDGAVATTAYAPASWDQRVMVNDDKFVASAEPKCNRNAKRKCQSTDNEMGPKEEPKET